MNVETLVDKNIDRFLHRLLALLRIPSVSADPTCYEHIDRAATYLADYLNDLLGDVNVDRQFGHPIITAQSPPDPDKPTVLFYGHYDVQPAEPADGWHTDPFQPVLQNGKITGRGAADNKGPVVMALAAVEILKHAGPLPVHVKVILEGEEEASGQAIFKYVETHRQRLACDLLLICDTGGFAPGRPAISYGARGLVYKQIDMVGPNQDLHSGSFGGVVPNPAAALVDLLARLIAPDGKIAIAGLYDRVRPIDPDEHDQFAALPYDVDQLRQRFDLNDLAGETEFLPLERLGCRPNLAINGLAGGYTGEGPKTVLPSRASAKISIRLVPDQRAADVSEQLDHTIRTLADPAVTTTITTMGLADPYLGPRTGPAIDAACHAIRHAFGQPPALLREGGTLPILASFKQHLTESILPIGFSRPDCSAHGPNEYFHLDDFRRGICALCRLLDCV